MGLFSGSVSSYLIVFFGGSCLVSRSSHCGEEGAGC